MRTVIPRTRERGGLRRALGLLVLAAGLAAAGTVPAAAASASGAKPVAAAAHAKPVPTPPPGIATGTADVPKPHNGARLAVRPLTAFSVTLTASPSVLWPTQYSTLTATANTDVGPTPDYIYILDLDTGLDVAKCGTGIVCAVSETYATPADHTYLAYISDSTDTYAARALAQSQDVDVDWRLVDLSLSATTYTLPVGASATLTETSSSDITTSPFYVEIWDTTTGTMLGICGVGTSCQVTVSQSVATTHSYIATLSSDTTTYPPANLQSSSPTDWITWTGSGLKISLSAPSITVNTPETVTATASVNVGPTPYFIEIFDENGTRIGECGTGSTCSVSYLPSRAGSNLVAFLSDSSTAYPPGTIQASSNTVSTTYEYIG